MSVRQIGVWVRRILLGIFGVQLLIMAVLVAIDSYRKRFRAPASFPHSSPQTLADDSGQARIYTYGQDLYDDMLAAIDAAEHEIFFETFIWKSDATGQRFKEALTRAAERGISVYVIYDKFANLVVPRSFFRFDDRIRVHAHPLLRGGAAFWLPTNWARDHRKLLIVDSQVAFVGGYNVGALYATDWRDTHVRFTGSPVPELENAFIDFWNDNTRRVLPAVQERTWLSPVRVHRNVPSMFVFPIRAMYLEAIDRATRYCWMTHAYLIPDEGLTATLIAAARRGVDVRIIVPAESNHVVADWLSRGFYRRLLDGGVRLFLFQNAMVHAKTATIDDVWCTIGTANLDGLSLAGNYEINVEILGPDSARVMADIFLADQENCVEVTLEEWDRRSALAKLTEIILAPLRPFF
ncbi:cardiolipin synthase [Naumannella cuiyingiana]|uniref:Cardiolipin synthase n=1 Tax=Naumannella cuiyingiana TaxID=1347891 RepID=A0A7Z0IKC1_9ACTN|nr:cardiolipin synthase [Naumannella cuiyingiana]